jgi:hypothetical protein
MKGTSACSERDLIFEHLPCLIGYIPAKPNEIESIYVHMKIHATVFPCN